MRRLVTFLPKESTIVIGIEKVLVLLQVLELYLVFDLAQAAFQIIEKCHGHYHADGKA